MLILGLQGLMRPLMVQKFAKLRYAMIAYEKEGVAKRKQHIKVILN